MLSSRESGAPTGVHSTDTEDGGIRPLEDMGPSSTTEDLLTPVAFDTDDNTPNRQPPATGFANTTLGLDNEYIQVQRVICEQDFPSSWQPARRIITFMGMVSLVCTLIVVAIILIAVALSKNAFPKTQLDFISSDIVYLVPHPRQFYNRTPTIVVHRQNPKIWQKHVAELAQLLKAYRDRQGTTVSSNCDLRYTPTGGSSCYFPLERISDNCSVRNNFGYDSGNPCVALVFNVLAGWSPKPFNMSNPNEIPTDIRSKYDPFLVYVTCSYNVTFLDGPSDHSLDIRFTPFHGFPLQFLPNKSGQSNVPPLVMIQFIGSKPHSDIDVTCTLWARNVPDHNHENSHAGTIKFNIFIV